MEEEEEGGPLRSTPFGTSFEERNGKVFNAEYADFKKSRVLNVGREPRTPSRS